MMMGGSSAVGGSSSRRMLKLTASILSILFVMMILWSNGGSNDNDIDSTATTMPRQLSSLQQFMDPKSTNLRTGIQSEDEQAKKLLEEQVMQKQANLIQEADRAISQGNVAFRVHAPGEEEGALFTPSELLIEVVNPNRNFNIVSLLHRSTSILARQCFFGTTGHHLVRDIRALSQRIR